MKIYIPNLSKAQEEEMNPANEKDLLKKEWQDFLETVCQSIEERRRKISPKAFRPKVDKSKS